MKTCFVVSPIGDEGSDIRKRADKVFKYIISPVCETVGFEAIRVDKLNQVDSINQTIIDYLTSADLVIADLSGHNPNAFYEMGYRASLRRPIIHLKEKTEKIPFDIAGIRAFDYELSDLDSVEEIKNRLIKTISTIRFEDFSADDMKEESIDAKQDLSQLVSLLYEIKDEIIKLKKEIREKDTETIQAVVRATVPSAPVEDAETAVLKAILPELIKNPGAMRSLIELGEMGNKN